MGTTGTGKKKRNASAASVKANNGLGGKSGAGKKPKDTAAVDAASAAASDARAEVEGLAAGAAAPTESVEDEDEEESDKEEERAAKGDKRGRRSNSGTPQGTPAKKKVNVQTELNSAQDECARHSDRAEKLALQKEVRELRAQLAGKNTVNIGCIHIFHVTDLTTLSAEHSSCQSEEAQIHWRCDQV